LRSYGGLKSQDVEKSILLFLEKQPLMEKNSKLFSERIHGDTDRRVVVKFREIWPTEIGKIVHTVRAGK